MAVMITFFMHIPKTGGLTFHEWLKRLYGPEGLLVWNPQRMWGLVRLREELAALLAERPGVRAVAGHYPYGVHEAIGACDHRYVTFLRDPVERWISERIHHLTKNADCFLLRREFAEIYGDPDLFRLLQATIVRDDDIDVQSRFMRHGRSLTPDGLQSGRDLSDAAIMERFWFIGRQESLAADCLRLAQVMGCGEIPLPASRNITGFGDVRGALTADEIGWIEARNAADIALCRRIPVATASPPAPLTTAPSRTDLAAAILHAAFRRISECFVALHADRLEAQKILDAYAAREATRTATC
jgi:hypothetical protein